MKKIGELKSFIGGISTGSKKQGPPYSFAFGRSIDFRSDPSQLTIQPKAVKLSSSIITDLPMDADIVNQDLFLYGNTGRIYKADINDTISLLHTVTDSQGNGLTYFPEDRRLYFANNTSLGYYSSSLPPFSITERWTTNTISSTWYDWSLGQATVSSGQLSLTTKTAGDFFGIELADAQDLTSYIATNQLVSVGSRLLASYEVYPLYIKIQGDSADQLFWFIDASNHLRAYKKVAGVNTIVASSTYDSTVHKFFRIYEDTGVIHYDYSTDGNNWIPFGSTANPFVITKVIIGTQVGSTAEASATSAVFDNFSFTPLNTNAQFIENFLETEGGEPTNTNSLKLIAASSQSAARADTVSLSITGDLTLEAALKMSSLPTGTNKMSIISKWNESGALRSYKLDIVPTSATFGDGSDSSLTVSVSATETVIDANCSGASGQNKVLTSNVTGSFAVGQKVLLHQTRGIGAGQYQLSEIIAVSGIEITLADNLNFSLQHSAVAADANKAQIRVFKQYTNVTINSGITWSAKAWDGFKGGILGFLANGTVTVTGTISASAKGFRGGTAIQGHGGTYSGNYGESAAGPSGNNSSANPNGGAGGGGSQNGSNYTAGGGGSYGAQGTAGTNNNSSLGGQPGLTSGSADLATLFLGNGGGAGLGNQSGGVNDYGGDGGVGGGINFIIAPTLTVSGAIISNGGNGVVGHASGDNAGGGAGSGGANKLLTQVGTLGSGITTTGGVGGHGSGNSNVNGGSGGVGRSALEYYSTYTGDATPALHVAQNDSLGLANGSALRLYISNDGTNLETYTQNIDNPIGLFRRFSVTWDASASTAKFYQNATLLGTRIGVKTAIHDNATEFAIGTSKNGAGTRSSFLDGLVDDVRVFNTVKTQAEISIYNNRVLTGLETGLVAYYKFDGDVTDSQTSGLNDLTANNTPTYSAEVAFKGITTRNDEDVFIDTSGQTYTLTTSLNEGATHRQTFAPTKEPLKSLAFNINTVGTGNWTVVIHDALNNEVAAVTVANADLQTGIYEFILDAVIRPVLNANYHIHVYSSVGDGKVVTGANADLETSYLKTFFQILVNDQYHSMKQFINFVAICNERYLAVLEAGSIYNPHRLIFPSGYRARCVAFWNGYIAIGTWKGTDVTDTDSAKIFFWDGTSETYIDPLEVPQGAINALFGTQGTLTISAGYKGKILEYTGGAKAQTKFRLPEMARGDYAEIAPNALTMWDSMVRIGATLNTNSTTIHQGIYTWGQQEDGDPMSLGYDHPLSVGDQQSSAVRIGCMTTRGQKLYTGFQNGNTFGIDVVDANAAPYDTARIELLITDLGAIAAQKLPLVLRADFEELQTDQSISLLYKPNRSSDWLPLTTQDNAGATDTRSSINQRVKETQFACDVVTAGLPLTITGFTLESEGEESGVRT